MIFSLDVRRARKGDCLLLHFGSRAEPGLVMIDGGPSNVYKPHLKPRLMEIRKARKLEDQQPLPVDLLMVSHVDDDHIQGILDLTREMTQNQSRRLVRVLSFWHNSFDDLIGNDPKELTAAVSAHFGPASLTGNLPPDADVESGQADDVVGDNLRVLASIEQGHRLRGDAETLGFPLNPEFDGKLILAGKKSMPVAEGLTFIVAGPMKLELKKLQAKHDAWLKEQKKKKRTGGAALAAYVDPSVTNLSSIVVLAVFGKKSMLLTGDARGDKILEGLELVGLLKQGGTMHVDVLKVPHHGSSNNLERNFFERITAGHYVFSGNGGHGNPEREALEMLFAARGKEPFEVHLTYPIDEIDVAREADWRKEQTKAKRRKRAGTSKQEPRRDWSAAEHSLAAFFNATKLAKDQKIHIADATKAHVIDLLDTLGY